MRERETPVRLVALSTRYSEEERRLNSREMLEEMREGRGRSPTRLEFSSFGFVDCFLHLLWLLGTLLACSLHKFW